MRITILVIAMIIVFPSFGQEFTTWQVDSIATIKANELLDENRTNEVLIFNSGCIGCEVLDEDCPCYDGYSMTYLIWEEESKVWFTQYDCCAHSETVELKPSYIWKEFQSNKKRIFKSKFKEDYFSIHNFFYYLKVLPNSQKKLRIYEHYFEDGHKFQNHNKKQYADEFRRNLQKALSETWD